MTENKILQDLFSFMTSQPHDTLLLLLLTARVNMYIGKITLLLFRMIWLMPLD